MKRDLDNIRKEMEAALKVISEKYSCTFEMGTMRYTGTTVKFPVELCKVIGGVTEQQRDFERLAEMYDLKAEDYGKIIKVNGREIKIVGINTRAPKYPIIGEENGRGIKMTLDMAKRGLEE